MMDGPLSLFESVQELAEQLGADGFLLKPVDAKQARLQISRVLRED